MRKIMQQTYLVIGLLLLFLISTNPANGQNTVTIGGTATQSDAVLWLVPNGNQGLILPVTNKFNASTAGMMIYDPSDSKVHFWNGSAWVDVTQGGSGTGNYTIAINGNNFELLTHTKVYSIACMSRAVM